MITYENVSSYPAAFHDLFGCSVDDFDALYAEFTVVHAQRIAQSTLTRKEATRRKRRPGAGRRFKHELRERLLLALVWLQTSPSLELLGRLFDLDKTSAEDNLKDMLATLETLDGFTLTLPDMRRPKLKSLQQLLDAYPDAALLLAANCPTDELYR